MPCHRDTSLQGISILMGIKFIPKYVLCYMMYGHMSSVPCDHISIHNTQRPLLEILLNINLKHKTLWNSIKAFRSLNHMTIMVYECLKKISIVSLDLKLLSIKYPTWNYSHKCTFIGTSLFTYIYINLQTVGKYVTWEKASSPWLLIVLLQSPKAHNYKKLK